MTHLQKIENAILDAQGKINSYRMAILLFDGFIGAPSQEIIDKHREEMADALTKLYQSIEPSVKVAPTPTGSDNVVTLAEEWHKC